MLICQILQITGRKETIPNFLNSPLWNVSFQDIIKSSGTPRTGYSFAYSTTEMNVKEEALMYPATSFVAEVGGALGLFLGFSFLGLWDMIIKIVQFIFNKTKT